MSEEILIRFTLSGDEAQLLSQIAAREERKPNQQARYILRRELTRRGLLADEAASPQGGPQISA